LGAFYGYEEMIKDKIVEENIKVLLECDSSKGNIVIPKEYGVVEGLRVGIGEN
jgi:hypothetical protein